MNCSHCVSNRSNYIAAGILSFFSFGHDTEAWISRPPEWHLGMTRIFTSAWGLFYKSAAAYRGNLRAPGPSLTAFLIIVISPPPPASVRKWECQTLLWWWWWLWLSTLNFNPPARRLYSCWTGLYVLLMMDKFQAWKAAIVGRMKDSVSTLSLSVSLFLSIYVSFLFLLSSSSYIIYSPSICFM